eukprot:CAMPEP_0197036546 /NCGR_PEP_ID=MMETSP1384-20130603/14021_1 /TAXON_ID=29189 /ORGANISM="Ammonia sp." /LENGTH=627 /DNA_ID=CAMNT_0042466735 /DNA_START=142 /DNA_END=2025 /DNA_ORIENTATION=+
MADASADTTTGAMIAIAASIFNAVGYTVQKKGHNRLKEYNKDKTKEDRKRLINERIWAIGFAIYLIGGLLNAVALFYAPQSLVLPLSAITLVVNTLLATKVLGEPFFKADIFGMLAVITGSILAVKFGPRTAGGEATMNELKLRWGDRDFFVFFVVLTACILVDYLLVRYYEKKNAEDEEVTDEIKHGKGFLLISYCLLAGYFGSLAFLFLKSFTEFIGSSISSKDKADSNATNWYSYFTLICVIITNFALEFFRQRGLSYFHAVYVVPINQVVLIVMGSVTGGLYFEEFDSMTALDGGLFVVAILMTVMGVFILAFNSGNVAEKTKVEIQEAMGEFAITLEPGDQTNNTFPGLPNLPTFITTSPSLPITRTISEGMPDLPPAGMAGPMSRIRPIHRSMASMQLTRDGKPFYISQEKLAQLRAQHLDVRAATARAGRTVTGSMPMYNGAGRLTHSASLPTQSGSSLADLVDRTESVELQAINGSLQSIKFTKSTIETRQKAGSYSTSAVSRGADIDHSPHSASITSSSNTHGHDGNGSNGKNGTYKNGQIPHINGSSSTVGTNGYVVSDENGKNGYEHGKIKKSASNLDVDKQAVEDNSPFPNEHDDDIVIVTTQLDRTNSELAEDD